MPRRTLLGLLATIAVLAAPTAVGASGPYKHTTQATDYGSGGAAATVDSVATTAATDVLRRGGNAVDATVAAAAVLGVTEPFSCGIGGGGFMVIRTPKGKVTTIDSREESPAAMEPDSFIENGAALGFNDARYSGLSAGVPGTVAGWERRPAQVRQLEHEARPRAGDRRRARRLRGRRDLLRPDAAEHPVVRRHPVDRGDLPRPRRDRARPGLRAAQPGHGEDVRADRPLRRRARLLPRRRRRGDGRGGAGPADRPDRRQRVAARPDDGARRQATTTP